MITSPSLMYLEHLTTLTSQVRSALAADYRPAVEPLARAYRLVLVSIGMHAAIAPHPEAALRLLDAWPNRDLAQLLVETQRSMAHRLAQFLILEDSLRYWCDERTKPAFAFWSQWEAPHAVHTALVEPSFPKAGQLVQEYALNVVTHRAAWQVALPRFSKMGAFILHLLNPKGRRGDEALSYLLHYMPRDAKTDKVPAAWAGWDQVSFTPAGRLTDADQERAAALWELLGPMRDLPLEDLLTRALNRDPELQYLPNRAAQDFLNRLKRYRQREVLALEMSLLSGAEFSSAETYAERHRRVTEPGGKDPSIWTAEEPRQALGGSPALERLHEFCLKPSPTFLADLTRAEGKAFEALQQAILQKTLPPEGGIFQEIADTAEVSPATVTSLMKKIRKTL